MPKKKQKLELTWIGKDEQPQLEPRILIEDPSKSYGDSNAENMLIHGDNLLALKALEQEFTGKVQCIYVDPPFNTGQAFQHYEDGVAHSLWLTLMESRIEFLFRLLSPTGTLWVHLDDNEVHYMKVLMDQTLGRSRFISSIVWRAADSSNNDAKQFSLDHNTILVYAKSSDWESFLLPRQDKDNLHYSNPDDDPRGPWFQGNLSSPNPRENLRFDVSSPQGYVIHPPSNGWRWSRERMNSMISTGEIAFSSDGTRVMKKTYLANQKGLSPSSLWSDIEDTGHNRQAKYELKKLFPDTPTAELFKTPKPERLIYKILQIATKEGDIVLDSFLGSGTTAAVAHKLGRRWIGAELGNAYSEACIPRLRKVCDGTDQGGVSKLIEWVGGGGFKCYELAPSLLKSDTHGNWVISDEYNADMLAAAMAKHEAFNYSPDAEIYWKQGKSSDKDFIFTTTSFVQVAFLDRLHEEMQEDEHLLICCKKFSAPCARRYSNIEIRKIPKMLLGKCEFGRDDYSLNIVNVPTEEDAPAFVPQGPPAAPTAKPKPKRKKGGRPGLSQPDLFGEGTAE